MFSTTAIIIIHYWNPVPYSTTGRQMSDNKYNGICKQTRRRNTYLFLYAYYVENVLTKDTCSSRDVSDRYSRN